MMNKYINTIKVDLAKYCRRTVAVKDRNMDTGARSVIQMTNNSTITNGSRKVSRKEGAVETA